MTQLKETPNELDFVDSDIKQAFEGKAYFVGTPTNVQLNRNLKLLIEKIDLLLKTKLL